MTVQLSLPKSIRKSGADRNDFDAKHITIKPIGAIPVRYVNNAMVKNYGVHDGNLCQGLTQGI